MAFSSSTDPTLEQQAFDQIVKEHFLSLAVNYPPFTGVTVCGTQYVYASVPTERSACNALIRSFCELPEHLVRNGIEDLDLLEAGGSVGGLVVGPKDQRRDDASKAIAASTEKRLLDYTQAEIAAARRAARLRQFHECIAVHFKPLEDTLRAEKMCLARFGMDYICLHDPDDDQGGYAQSLIETLPRAMTDSGFEGCAYLGIADFSSTSAGVLLIVGPEGASVNSAVDDTSSRDDDQAIIEPWMVTTPLGPASSADADRFRQVVADHAEPVAKQLRRSCLGMITFDASIVVLQGSNGIGEHPDVKKMLDDLPGHLAEAGFGGLRNFGRRPVDGHAPIQDQTIIGPAYLALNEVMAICAGKPHGPYIEYSGNRDKGIVRRGFIGLRNALRSGIAVPRWPKRSNVRPSLVDSSSSDR